MNIKNFCRCSLFPSWSGAPLCVCVCVCVCVYQSCRLQGWTRIMPGAKQAWFKFAAIYKAVRDKQFEASIYLVMPQWIRGF